MFYLLVKVIKKIRNNAVKYSLVALQVFIGISLLTVFLTISSSITHKYENLKSKAENSLIKLKIYLQQQNSSIDSLRISDDNNFPLPFSIDDYNWIKEKYKSNLDISIIVKKNMNFIVSSKGVADISTVSFLFVTDSFFNIYYPNKKVDEFSSTSKVYIGKKALETLINGKLPEDSVSLYKEVLTSNQIVLLNDDVLEITPMDNLYENSSNHLTLYVTVESGNLDLDECVILPIKYLSEKTDLATIANMFVTFKFINSDFASDIGAGIISYLYKKYGDLYDYNFDTTLSEYLRQTNVYKAYSLGLMILSIFILLIISIGLTSIILIIINQRTREIAISLTLGATIEKIFLEIIMESTFVTIQGGLIGIVVSILLLKTKVHFSQFEIIIDFKILLFSFCVSMLIGIISSILPIKKIKNITPIKILHSL
ncbi:hypothetical protein CDQ84_18955 [Clostridium thermosuccinogenes]|jgi:ABC-type antimicrobial peptide transport system permease subunit|uniref:ABC3 transporter permease C-terminal domain-containing protein n=1 Tax=Clostridium thermosuccinogenes TaxID=84032 RepID=A0A2K2EZJ2_9CLOT|nr:FtsX-like permease family protein [Pseudoclostridium thermosuccinogenes]AUS97515.1 hypothetical protein CDO33_14345 [Pseudoclostridium thermosuccinogenes]PNT91773.1 hypothetical protein CDQ85_18890 [Pseudoclostridium thermosuccinogenes]PNT91958.1 hypothetical protein CDQ84_18955 [Pseudoclostridium thermosuccinogenes]